MLPEAAVSALRRKAVAQQLLPPLGDAAAEWRRLSVLLKLLQVRGCAARRTERVPICLRRSSISVLHHRYP